MEDRVALDPEVVGGLLLWLMDGFFAHEAGKTPSDDWWEACELAIQLLLKALADTKGGPDPRMN